jgi:Flp pilus assembly protein TadD
MPAQLLSPPPARAQTPGLERFEQGLHYQAQDRSVEAARAYLRALQLQPSLFQAAFNLGLLLQKTGRLEDAIGCYRHALKYNPNLAPAWVNLGAALRETDQGLEAVTSFRQALRHGPRDPEVLNQLGNALRALQRYPEAIASYQEALGQAPGHPGIHLNLGDALRACGQVDQAITCLQHAVQVQPGFAEAHWSLAFALLLQGDFSRGFAEYEWRWWRRDYPRRQFTAPLWQGQGLAGRTLLVHTEQGAGDSIQFVRFLTTLAARGARVVLECPSSLRALFRSAAGAHCVFTRGESPPRFDYHVPLLSLPHLLGVTLQSLPAATPYLRPLANPRVLLPQSPAQNGACLKVGLAWRGNPKHVNDSQRSIPLPCLAPLFALPNVTFYSLQVSTAAEFSAEAAAQNRLIDLAGELHDFADTANAIAQLDAVISVDTSVAHLAGALGRPTWVLLPFAPDWRWMLKRDDSPWYPTVRLFRQTEPGNWSSVIERVCSALIALSQSSLP